MEEIQRFLRFTIPGLITAMQLGLVFQFSGVIDICPYIYTKTTLDSIGVGLNVFIASGALGFVIANIYFSLYWNVFGFWAIDHRPALKKIKGNFHNSNGVIKLDQSYKHRKEIDLLSTRDAWNIATQFLNSTIKESKKIEGMNKHIMRFSDITHALGATCTGSILSYIICIIILIKNGSNYTLSNTFFVVIMVVWLGLIFLVFLEYRAIKNSVQAIVNSTIVQVIELEEIFKNGANIYYVK
jgi:hypothetical protein